MLEAFLSQMGGGLGKGLGEAIGGGGGPAVSSAQAAAYGTTLNGSGWVVNLGSGARMDGVTASPTSAGGTTVPDGLLSANSLTQAGGGMLPLMLGGMLLVFLLRKRKGA